MGPGDPDTKTGTDKGLGPQDLLKFTNAPIQHNGPLLTSLNSDLTIDKSIGISFAGGGGLEFGLLDLSNNIIAAIDINGNGTFDQSDVSLDVQDNITEVNYNYATDTFTFIV